MLDSITARTLIKNAMPVVCAEGGQLAVVDRLEGDDTIKLATNGDGQPHYIPLSWVTSVDDSIHIDHTGDQAMAEWSSTPPNDADGASDGTEPPHYINSVDATVGQPMVTRVLARQHELEASLEALPAADIRARGDVELALSTIGELLTGDLDNVPSVVVAAMSRWLENTKHLAESAVVPATVVDPVLDAVTGPMIAGSQPAPAPESRA